MLQKLEPSTGMIQSGARDVGDVSGEASLLGGIDLRQLWASIYRNRWPALLIVGATLAAGILLSLLATPIYQASASIQIDQEAAKVIGTEQTNASAAIQDSDRFLRTQVDVLQSRSLRQAVAEDLGLFDNAEFLEKMDEDQVDEAKGRLTLEATREENVLRILAENMSVSLPVESRVAQIFFSSPDPELAMMVANSFAENFIRNNLQRKFDTSAYAREFLKEQLDGAAKRLSASERQALAYARQSRIIDTGSAGEGAAAASAKSLTTSTLVQLNQTYAAAVARRIDAQKRWEAARRGSALDLPIVQSNLAVQRLLEERAKVRAEYQEELQRRKEDYPTVRQAEAKIRELSDQIDRIAAGIRATLREEYDAARAQEEELSRRLASLKEATLTEQGASVELSILRREAETNRQLYDLLLKRYNELNAEAGVQANNLAIIDEANTPIKPVSPNLPVNILLSLLAGLIFAGLYVFGREQLFSAVRTPDDVSRLLNLSLIGSVPKMPQSVDIDKDLLDPKGVMAEAYASVRTALLLSSNDGLPKSITFLSTTPSEGKSTSCFAVSLSLARLGKRVCVIDLDLRKPSQHKFFELTSDHVGMSELLSQNADFDQAVRKTKFANIDFIGSGHRPPNPTDLLTGAYPEQLLADIQSKYDVVMIDSAPVLGLSDALLVSDLAALTIFVVESGRIHAGSVQNALARLRQSNGHIGGVLLTKFDAQASGYSNYEYQYQYRYGH